MIYDHPSYLQICSGSLDSRVSKISPVFKVSFTSYQYCSVSVLLAFNGVLVPRPWRYKQSLLNVFSVLRLWLCLISGFKIQQRVSARRRPGKMIKGSTGFNKKTAPLNITQLLHIVQIILHSTNNTLKYK